MIMRLAKEVIKSWFIFLRVGFMINSYTQTRKRISKHEPKF